MIQHLHCVCTVNSCRGLNVLPLFATRNERVTQKLNCFKKCLKVFLCLSSSVPITPYLKLYTKEEVSICMATLNVINPRSLFYKGKCS